MPRDIRDRSVEVRYVVADGGEVHPLEGVPALPGLDAGDAEQRVEGREHLVGFAQRGLGERRRGFVAARVAELLEAGAKTAERRAQVVGHVVGDPAHVVHQRFDARQHRVQVRHQLVELVAASVALDALRQLAFHDAARRPVDGLDARRHAPAQPPRDGDREDPGDADAPGHVAHDGRAHRFEVPQIASDQEVEPPPELEVPGPCVVHLGAVGVARGVQLELDPRVRAPRRLRPTAQIAREHTKLRVGEKVDRGACGVARNPLADEGAQAPYPRDAVALRETLHLGFDHRLHLPVHEALGGDVDEDQKCEHRDPEQHRIPDGDAPRDAAGDRGHGRGRSRGPVAVMARGSRSPRRARCG